MTVERQIGIPTPTSRDLQYNRRSWPMYAAAVHQAGGTPREIPLDISATERLSIARECYGIVLPGSPFDVDPRWYGQDPVPACSPADLPREETDRALLEDCDRSGKPLLGICYGMQSLNVWRGGTLVQDLPYRPVNHSAGASVAVAHSAVVTPGGLLAGLVDTAEVMRKLGETLLPINSSHHQSGGQVGTGLRLCAVSPEDGVVEAVEGIDAEGARAFLLGVQWHPERSIDISATSRAIFRGLIEAVVLWEHRNLSSLASR